MDMDKLVSLCKRRGFIFPSSEIYGGINGFWDYGPLGVELKRNIKEAWWRDNVQMRDDMVGLDCSIIMNPRVWEASGHVGGFSDPMVDCRATKDRYRADQLFVFAYGFLRFLLELWRDDVERGSYGPMLAAHIYLPACLLLFAVGFVFGISLGIKNERVRAVARVLAFVPPIAPIRASTWHLTIASVALSSVALSTTASVKSPLSIATVSYVACVPEKSF